MDLSDIIDRVQRGDKQAYRQVVSGYQNLAFNVAVSVLQDEFLAKDAVQNAFVKAYLKLGTFRGDASFKTWFTSILIREAYQLLRKNRRNVRVDSDAVLAGEGTLEVSASTEHQEDQKAHQSWVVQQAFRKLPADDALVLKLFYLEDFSLHEIREATGWSDSAVKVKLHRARKKMKTLLSENMNLSKEDVLV
jgi:RNA polymerase sigma-70 factor (ECF subfamily)